MVNFQWVISMRTVYLDSVLILNFAMDLAMLILTAKICGIVYKLYRACVSALFGAVWAALSSIYGGVFADPFVSIAVAAAMVFAAYGKNPDYLRLLLVFLAVSAAFAGLGSIENGSVIVLFTSFFAAYLVFSLVFRGFMAKKVRREETELEIFYHGKSVRITALADTGNALYDPMRGMRVTVCTLDSVMPLFDRETAVILRSFEVVEAVRRLHGFSLIPYVSVGKEGFLAAFVPEKVIKDGKEVRCAIAIDPSRTLAGSGCEAISYVQ